MEPLKRTIRTNYGIIIYLGLTDVIHAIRQHFVRFVTLFFSIINTFYSRDKLMKDRRKLESAEHDHVSYYTFYVFTLHNYLDHVSYYTFYIFTLHNLHDHVIIHFLHFYTT